MSTCLRCALPKADHDCWTFLSKQWDIESIPEHMRETAEFYRSDTYSGFSPELYKEDECECGRPIYFYQMDLEMRWRHFDHRRECIVSPLAKPKERK